MTSKGERRGSARAQPPKIKHHVFDATRLHSRARSPPRTTTPEDTGTSNRRRRGESSPRDGSVALRRNGSSRRRPGANPGGGDRGAAGVRRPRGESCVAIRWVTAWGTTRGSRTVAPEWDIARFGEIGFAPWSRGEGRWARASSRRASRQASRQPRPARSKTGFGSGDESTIGSSWSSALAGEARASWCVRRAGFPACASRENLRGDCTQIKMPRQGDARDGAYLGADAEGDATLGGGLRGELAVGDGSEETVGARGAPEGAYPGAPSRQERPIDWSGCDTAVPMSSPGKRRARRNRRSLTWRPRRGRQAGERRRRKRPLLLLLRLRRACVQGAGMPREPDASSL